MYTSALYWKRATKAGAIAGLVTGSFVTLFWYLFIHKAESAPLGIAKMLIGRDVLITQMPWPVVDPLIVAFPLGNPGYNSSEPDDKAAQPGTFGGVFQRDKIRNRINYFLKKLLIIFLLSTEVSLVGPLSNRVILPGEPRWGPSLQPCSPDRRQL